MRTALFLLLLLAFAAIPGSVYPQRSADPNGVRLFFDNQPELAKVLDSIQIFDVYTSVWFSSIYILLFVSLIGCVVPRTKIHYHALRAKPVKTPAKLDRMPIYRQFEAFEPYLDAAQAVLKKSRIRFTRSGNSISAEKGYLKETGNLVFHYSLIGVLIAVGVGGGLSFSGQRVLVEGETFVNNLASYDSFSPGPFFNEENLQPFDLKLEDFEVVYDLTNLNNRGQPIDFIATVTALGKTSEIKVNSPLAAPGANIYLTGNGFAPVITVRDGEGNIAYSGPVVFLPQDSNMTSLGVIKVPDANPEQLGFISFFYPTAEELESGAYTSIYPDPFVPLLTMNLYSGDLGLDNGVPKNVFALDTSNLKEVASRNAENPPLQLEPGDVVDLPDNLGSVSFDGLLRFASLDVAYNPGGIWVLGFALLALGSLALSLMIPRRRIWFRFADGKIEAAALARNDDPGLEDFLQRLVLEINKEIEKK
ncbi:MAG: cytochrome c biogenesis protein ResB [Aquiluna sp.]|nr:cytochrome c biogenesis protein ResB [Aquiluna sp.]MCF8545536.1 cytochrome c biogenesis protein ResB [Aquiluna sp.]